MNGTADEGQGKGSTGEGELRGRYALDAWRGLLKGPDNYALRNAYFNLQYRS